MNIFEVLDTTITGRASEWVNELKDRLGQEQEYSWVLPVNSLLEQLPSAQIDILRSKFKGINNTWQFFDKLIEILVAVEYKNMQPEFLSDSISGPDIFLKKSQEYIEVKHLNYSDEYKAHLKKISSGRVYTETRNASVEDLHLEDQDRYERLFDFSKEKIEKGAKQIFDKPGFIYFVYDIDSPSFSLARESEISARLERDIGIFFKDKIEVKCKSLSYFGI